MIAYILVFLLCFTGSCIFFPPCELTVLVLANIDNVPALTMFGHELHVAKYATGFPWLLPVAAAIGSNFGSSILYLMGSGSLKLSGKLKSKLEGFDFERLGKARETVLFVSAVTSIPPVTPTALAAGMINYGLGRYFLVTLGGKILRFYIVLILGRTALDFVLKYLT